MLTTGCPKAAKTVRDLRVKSAELSTYAGKLCAAFGEAFTAGEINRAQLMELNNGCKVFASALGAYRDAVAEAERVVAGGGTLPTDTIGVLKTILDDRVISAFFDIMVKVGLMPIAQSTVVQTVISSIRLTILALQGLFAEAQNQLRLPMAATEV